MDSIDCSDPRHHEILYVVVDQPGIHDIGSSKPIPPRIRNLEVFLTVAKLKLTSRNFRSTSLEPESFRPKFCPKKYLVTSGRFKRSIAFLGSLNLQYSNSRR